MEPEKNNSRFSRLKNNNDMNIVDNYDQNFTKSVRFSNIIDNR
jgi:hypothetical protein